MTGDATCLFCSQCEKHIYNLSEMTRDRVHQTLENNECGLCIRAYKRTDGTVLTTDCPAGIRHQTLTSSKYTHISLICA